MRAAMHHFVAFFQPCVKLLIHLEKLADVFLGLLLFPCLDVSLYLANLLIHLRPCVLYSC